MGSTCKMLGIAAVGAIGGLFLQGCGGDGPSSPTATTTGHLQTANYPADKLQFAGRWYDSNNDKVNGYGQQVTAKFTGSDQVGIFMSATPTYSQSGLYFDYKIDDGEWQREKLSDGSPHILAHGLDRHQNHTVTFGRSDEASDGTFTFTDWALDSGYTALTLDTPLSYEAIGDSITAGFMSECNAQAQGGCSSTGVATTNVYKTYVRHLADHWLTTDWSTVSRTGVGIVGNEPSNHAMIDLYKCRAWYATNCLQKWDFSSSLASHPDVITINLGTNDFAIAGPGSPSKADYQGNYTDFVSFVRSVHPDATIFCINPLQYSIAGAPAGRPPNQYTDMMNAIKDGCESLNDPKISYIDTGSFGHGPLDPTMEHTVDSTHPTAAGHEMFAEFLIPLLTPIVRQNNPHVRLPAPTGLHVLV